MSLSLNEVEAVAKKATRGAGYPWGLAEEAAKATRWLCARGVDGCAALAALLERADGSDLAEWRPVPGAVWTAPGGRLCPIAAGAAIADGLADFDTEELRLGPIAAPVLLLPFVAQRAKALATALRLEWPGGGAVTDGEELAIEGQAEVVAAHVTIGLDGAVERPNALCSRSDPGPAIRGRLERFAHRTYAPATEDSRLKGAGAGLSDND